MNRSIRRKKDDEIGNGAKYKRHSEIWDSPSDGKTYFGDWSYENQPWKRNGK